MNQTAVVKGFTHLQGGHCESSAVSSIVTNYGLSLSEPMAFGISSAITFFYFPLIKVWGSPMLSFRMKPGAIVKGVQKRLGVRFVIRTYKDENQGMEELDSLLDQGKAVGLQVGTNHLTYFLPEFRIFFNGHNAIVCGREGDEYIMSDPIFDHLTRIKRDDLRKARFSKGPNAPHGFMYYPEHVPSEAEIDYRTAIRKAIRTTVNMMLQPMFHVVGVKGIRTVARVIDKMDGEPDRKKIVKFLTNLILFQEEIGTGGGGFRFMYAAFLQEAHDRTGIPDLLKASKMMVETGDVYRQAAVACAKIIKGKQGERDVKPIARLYRECADREEEVYLLLKKIRWR